MKSGEEAARKHRKTLYGEKGCSWPKCNEYNAHKNGCSIPRPGSRLDPRNTAKAIAICRPGITFVVSVFNNKLVILDAGLECSGGLVSRSARPPIFSPSSPALTGEEQAKITRNLHEKPGEKHENYTKFLYLCRVKFNVK